MWVNWVRSRKPLKLQQPILTRLSRPRKTAPRLAARCLGKQPLPGERRWDAQGCFQGLRSGRGGATMPLIYLYASNTVADS
jgi:hypothetical protein